MSAYQLSNDQYQLLTDWLFSEAIHKAGSHWHDIRKFIGFCPSSDEFHLVSEADISKAVTNTIRNYYNLNRLALVTRYGDSYDRNDEQKFYHTHRSYTEKEAILALKSLRYQCGEYLTSDTKLFESLGIFIGAICENIVVRGY